MSKTDEIAARLEEAAGWNKLGDDIFAILDERDRLRAALKRIDDIRYAHRHTVTPDRAWEAFNLVNSVLCDIFDIARAALEGKTNDT